MKSPSIEFGLRQEANHWAMRVWCEDGGFIGLQQDDVDKSLEVQIRYDHSPLQEVKLVLNDMGDEYTIITKEEYQALIEEVGAYHNCTDAEAAEMLGRDETVLRAECMGIPARSIKEQALKRWEAIKLLVNPSIAS